MFERSPRCTILVHHTPNFTRVARLRRENSTHRRLVGAAELPAHDIAALDAWMEQETADAKGWRTAYCGFHPPSGHLIREELVLRNDQPSFDKLQAVVQRRTGLPADQRQLIGLIDATTGAAIPPNSGPQTALLVAMTRADVSAHQKVLLKHRVLPQSLEFDMVTMVGALTQHFGSKLATTTIAVCAFGPRTTTVYLLDRKGVQPRDPLPFGLDTLIEATQSELKLESFEAAAALLETPDERVQQKMSKLLAVLTGHLRLTLDYFEHQTGRNVGSLFTCNLPAHRQWLAPALAQAVDLPLTAFDVSAWAEEHGLIIDGVPNQGTGWLTTLALADTTTPARRAPDA